VEKMTKRKEAFEKASSGKATEKAKATKAK
jgi:hypothetical protein